MKKIYLLTSLTVFLFSLQAQELMVAPAFPLDTSSISIVVDCSKGNQGLLNYGDTGDVYVHVGVITNLSASSSDWRYVPFTWGTTNPAAHATSLGNNRYAYTISNIRSFFAVPAAETILRVAVLFRNGSGSLAQRNADASDMYVVVYGNGLAAKFIQPPFQPMYTPIPEPIIKTTGSTLPVTFVSNQNATLNLYFNGTLIKSVVSADSISALLNITATGNLQIIATATSGASSQSDTILFYVGGATQIAALPPGVTEGINYLAGDTSVVLVLFAPHKRKIIVIGDFNSWTQEAQYQMNETPDSNYFWIRIGGLTPGTEYAYQYVMDDTLTLADYNTEKVLDAAVDPSISSTTYPNLKSFPASASGTLASIIQTARPPYNWQVTGFQRPANVNLRIYELLARDFTPAGNWQTLMDTLSYLKSLGINAIEVMPFSNFEGASSWGYNPNFYFAPDKVYGTETALKQFIDACHQQGMAVIMDMVLNHSFGSSPMVQMYWDKVNNIPASGSPWFSPYYTHDYDVGYQFNNANAATQNFRARVIAYWLQNYHIDGYRFDLATGFTKVNSCNANGTSCNDNIWNSYDTTRINIWNALYAAEQAASPGSLCILEMFSVNSERAVYANNGMMVWNDMSNNYEQSTMGYSSGWDLSGSTAAASGVAQKGLINYQGSHDDERLMYKNEAYGNSSGSYNIKDTATGLVRNEMAAAFWAMIPGPKMIYEFDELGYDYSINWCTNGTVDPAGSCRLVPKPPRWDYLQVAQRKHLHDVYASLFKLNAAHPMLAASTNYTYSLSGTFRTLQLADSEIAVTVIGNFDVNPASASVTFQTQGTWYDYTGTDSITATGTAQNITLNPGDYKVYINKKTNDTSVQQQGDTSGLNGFAVRVYPNPVINSSTYVEYHLTDQENVDLCLYDLMGRRLSSYNLGNQIAGVHTIQFNQLPYNVLSLPRGVYIAQIISGSKKAHFSFVVLQ
jgi:glycosidase